MMAGAYGEVQSYDPQPAGLMVRPVSKRLEDEEKRLKERLMEVQKLRETMNENPHVQEIIDGLSKLGNI